MTHLNRQDTAIIPAQYEEGPRQPFTSSPVVKTTMWIMIALLVASVAVGGYHLAEFGILTLGHYLQTGWFTTSNLAAWVISALLILLIFGAFRYVTFFVFRLFRFVFRFAQSDVVTLVVAGGANFIFLMLDAWLTSQTITLMSYVPVENWFTWSNWVSIAALFIMYAGALVWIPRTGIYGENAIGSAIDDGNRW